MRKGNGVAVKRMPGLHDFELLNPPYPSRSTARLLSFRRQNDRFRIFMEGDPRQDHGALGEILTERKRTRAGPRSRVIPSGRMRRLRAAVRRETASASFVVTFRYARPKPAPYTEKNVLRLLHPIAGTGHRLGLDQP